MANDLSDLDVNQPLASGPVSEGDDKIRETRANVVNWAGIEHHLTGEHKFVVGAVGSRPSAGNSGRIWINTDNSWMERDDGSNFVALHAAQASHAITAGEITTNGETWTVIQTLNVTTLSSHSLIVLASYQLAMSTDQDAIAAITRIRYDGTTLSPGETSTRFAVTGLSGVKDTISFCAIHASPSSGEKAITLECYPDIGNNDSVASLRLLIALVT